MLIGLSAALCAPGAAASPPAVPGFGPDGRPAAGCDDAAPDGPLDLPSLVALALCRSPATAAAWASARAAAERIVQASAAYGPRIDGSLRPEATVARRWGGGFPAGTDSSVSATAALAVSWLLFDFGGRDARTARALAQRDQALALFADRAQALILEVALAYHEVLGAREALAAARANLAFAETSLAAATARERAGVGIRSDRLQADAAVASALLRLRQAEGALAIQEGRLATAILLPPGAMPPLAPWAPGPGEPELPRAAEPLIEEAIRLRPDLRSAEAAVAAAEAGVALADAQGRPSITIGAGPSVTIGSRGQDVAAGSAGVTLSVPLFDSGVRASQSRESRREAERARFERDAARQQAGFDVWQRFQRLRVEAANLATSARLLASADEAAALAQGRYRAGVAPIVELLNAQAALASAREQRVAAILGVRIAELELARAIGTVGDAVR